MPDFFEQTILEASLAYVEFPVSDRKVATGRRVSRTEYPYRDGQGVEELGRKPYVFNLTVPLFRGLDVSYYPDTYQLLLAVIEDPEQRGSVEYVDPEFGPVQVQILDYDVTTSGERRDGVMLSLVLEERGLDQSLLSNLTKPELAGAARASLFATQVDQEVAFIDLPDEDKPPFRLSDTWGKFQDALNTAAMTADEVAALLDEVYFVVSRFLNFSAKDELERWSLFNTLIDFAGAAEDAANQNDLVQTIEVVLQADMSAYDIATHYHNDADRADEVIHNNPTANPMRYPRGTTIRIVTDAQTPAERPGYGAQR
jgi:prophage DNA circulation protein